MRPQKIESLVLMVVLGCASLAGQTGPKAKPATPSKAQVAIPRTADGRPDLNGIWDYATITPLERPAQFAGKTELTAEEQEQWAQQDEERQIHYQLTINGVGSYNREWYHWGLPTNRSSLIVDPPDGRLPAAMPRNPGQGGGQGRPAGPEDLSPGDRCIAMSGPPFRPGAYNNNVGLFLTTDTLVIHNEMIHNSRIVPLDGRPHRKMPQWSGDSIGHWEGDTLVVDTINFRSDVAAGKGKHLIERFQRVDASTIEYTATIDDPATYVRPYTLSFPLRQSRQPIFEFACHEGNYSMTNRLAIARAQDAEDQKAHNGLQKK
jgi:hypothetical protein